MEGGAPGRASLTPYAISMHLPNTLPISSPASPASQSQSCAERFTSDQQDLRPEPSLESFGVVIPKGEEGAQAGGASGAGEAGPSGKRVAGGAAEAPRPSAEGEDQEQEEEPGFWMPEGGCCLDPVHVMLI